MGLKLHSGRNRRGGFSQPKLGGEFAVTDKRGLGRKHLAPKVGRPLRRTTRRRMMEVELCERHGVALEKTWWGAKICPICEDARHEMFMEENSEADINP